MFLLKRKSFNDYKTTVMKQNVGRAILKPKHIVTRKIQLNIKNIWIGQIKLICATAVNFKKTLIQ